MTIISDDTIDKTTYCDCDFACLENNFENCCEIDICVNQKVHFVKKLKRLCHYNLPFGESFICQCPVRTEYYRLQKK